MFDLWLKRAQEEKITILSPYLYHINIEKKTTFVCAAKTLTPGGQSQQQPGHSDALAYTGKCSFTLQVRMLLRGGMQVK